jgi:hypothetical protein
MPRAGPTDSVRFHLDALRIELADLAYDLERRGRLEAADVAMAVRARLGEIAAEPREADARDKSPPISLSLPL